MTTMGWGLDPWGIGPWGGLAGGVTSTLQFVSAEPTSNRTLHVVLSKEPAHLSTLNVGDALNPRTWLIQRLDTGEYFTVLSVKPYRNLYTEWEILVLQEFAPYGVTHQLSSTTLADASGSIVAGAFTSAYAPAFVNFQGCAALSIADERHDPQDLVNDMDFGMRVDSSGDYAQHSGSDLLKKLIIRRITTAPGEFFYLTDYGLGVHLKEPLGASDLIKFKSELQRQIMNEIDVVSADVKLSMSNNTLQIQVSATMSSGSQASATVDVSTGTQF